MGELSLMVVFKPLGTAKEKSFSDALGVANADGTLLLLRLFSSKLVSRKDDIPTIGLAYQDASVTFGDDVPW